MKSRKKILQVITAVPLLLVVVTFAIMSISARRPDNLGIHDGRLAPCPSSPNAVSTTATDVQHQMSPIPYVESCSVVIAQLQQIIDEMPRSEIITVSPNYLHAEFTSRIFRFIDDVEFYCDESNGNIHFRSASRVGHSDFGVNRSRMEKITAAFIQNQP